MPRSSRRRADRSYIAHLLCFFRALAVGLQGRYQEAEGIARADLPPEEATANVAYLRDMLSGKRDWKKLGRTGAVAAVANGS